MYSIRMTFIEGSRLLIFIEILAMIITGFVHMGSFVFEYSFDPMIYFKMFLVPIMTVLLAAFVAIPLAECIFKD